MKYHIFDYINCQPSCCTWYVYEKIYTNRVPSTTLIPPSIPKVAHTFDNVVECLHPRSTAGELDTREGYDPELISLFYQVGSRPVHWWLRWKELGLYIFSPSMFMRKYIQTEFLPPLLSRHPSPRLHIGAFSI